MITEPYRPRRTESLGVVDHAGWTVKVIGITAGEDLPTATEVGVFLRAAEWVLPSDAGIAFLIVHRGTEALWAILGRWVRDILYHSVFRADPTTPADVELVPPDGPSACVWELLAIDHERRVWVDNVLRRPDNPDLAGYLAADHH